MKPLLSRKSTINPIIRKGPTSHLKLGTKLTKDGAQFVKNRFKLYYSSAISHKISTNFFINKKQTPSALQIRRFCTENSIKSKKTPENSEISNGDIKASEVGAEWKEELIDMERNFFGELPDVPRRRTFLYVPASDVKKIQKSATLEADILCFDLEDGVSGNEKKQARRNLSEWLPKLKFIGSEGQKPEILIRVNRIGSGLEVDDIKSLFGKASFIPDGIVIPKCEDASQIQSIVTLLSEYENRAYVNSMLSSKDKSAEMEILSEKDPNKYIEKVVSKMKRFNIYCCIESAKGLLNLSSILSSDERIEGILFGAEDYRNSIRSNFNSYFMGNSNSLENLSPNQDLAYARSHIINCCSAFGKDAIDKVSIDFNSDAKSKKLLYEEARESCLYGFVGKQIIHPNQISIVHKAFAPSVEETMEAMRVVKSFLDHQKIGQGVFQLDGKMIDSPIAIQAARIIQRGRLSGDLSFEEAELKEEDNDNDDIDDNDLEVDKDLLEDLKLVDIEGANLNEVSEVDALDSIEFDSGVDVEDQLDKLLEKKRKNSKSRK